MNPEIIKVLEHFSSSFNATYLYMTGKQKKEIAYLSPTIFTRWYYSALFPETILSPAAIFNSQPENIVDGKGFFSINMHFKNISSDTLNFSYRKNLYSVEDHPIYKDLEILIDYIDPIMYVDSDSNLFEKDIYALQRKLSISDKYYVEYLYALSERLDLINEMTALFDNCIQPNRDNVFFKLPNSQKLSLIIDESCGICAENLNLEIHFDFCDISAETIYELLKNPISIDDIFINLYQNSDINLEDVWTNSDTTEISEEDKAILSSVYYIGIYFDKAFIFMFGNYLRLIQPIYSFPLKFRQIINSLYTSISIDGERESEIFIPCTAYTHSLLGKILFNSYSPDKKNYPTIPLDKIIVSLSKEETARKAALECLNLTNEPNTIYSFKAIYNSDKSLWKKVEIEKDTALTDLGKHTFLMFMFPNEKEFSIKIKEGGKETAQHITLPQNDFYNSVSTKVSDIIPCVGKSIEFISPSNNTIELQYLGSKNSCIELLYPRITSQSLEITELEHKIYSLDFLIDT